MRLPTSVLALLLLSSAASADPGTAPSAALPGGAVTGGVAVAPTYAIGARVGGYGFRREGDASSAGWDQCRMNGIGVFGQRRVHGPVFLEAGLDTYFSTNQAQPSDLPIDRQSALLSVAAGVGTQFTSWLHGYAQLGAGVELTRVAVPYGDSGTIRDNKALPDGFLGIGADIRIARGTSVGASLRTLVMGNFKYDPARLQMDNAWVATPMPDDVFAASPTLAAQAQFYLRREL